jgi:sigma-B regulation protein RsbU (phosphoserine phosphatase)
MPDYSELKQNLTTLESLERELNLKQLQINRLLNITQAINNNVSADGLFNMYKSFLSWEIGIKRMALYFKEDEEWPCAASIGIDDQLLKMDIRDTLPRYTRLNNLEATEHPLLRQFEVVIPVRHKEDPIAYVFIGGFDADDDMYSKVQFITAITNVIAVAIENKRLFKKQLEQEGFKREMELASEIQRMLIPKKLPSTEAYELSSIYKPQLGIGGDYFDFVEFENGKIVFAIGDVSGKGIGAALLMANFQANFQTLINKRSSLEDFVRDLNYSVHQITKGDRFITFFVA